MISRVRLLSSSLLLPQKMKDLEFQASMGVVCNIYTSKFTKNCLPYASAREMSATSVINTAFDRPPLAMPCAVSTAHARAQYT